MQCSVATKYAQLYFTAVLVVIHDGTFYAWMIKKVIGVWYVLVAEEEKDDILPQHHNMKANPLGHIISYSKRLCGPDWLNYHTFSACVSMQDLIKYRSKEFFMESQR